MDTSVLVSLHHRDGHTQVVEDWLRDVAHGPLWVTPWAITEFASALRLLVRQRTLTEDALISTLERFRAFVEGRAAVHAIVALDFGEAASLCANPRVGLRAGDALHVAAAKRLGCKLVTSDKKMHDGALEYGLESELLGSLKAG